jgi:hypothetical protein
VAVSKIFERSLGKGMQKEEIFCIVTNVPLIYCLLGYFSTMVAYPLVDLGEWLWLGRKLVSLKTRARRR